MVEINDDGQEVRTDIHTLPYVNNASKIKEDRIRQIQTFIAEREISISEECDAQFTNKWREQMERIL